MALSVLQNATAVAAGITTYFAGSGGTAPYTYFVKAGGAGGTINSSSGLYTAPSEVSPEPARAFDTIIVRDALNVTAYAKILVTTPLGLFCDIIENQMAIPGRVWFWDQKIMQPTDSDLYVAVSVMSLKPFGNNKSYDPTSGLVSKPVVYTGATLDIDIISRGTAARDRKEEVLWALNSDYSERQQEANSFHISRLPGGRFINLSQIDGAAIPYRFKISMNVQYAARGSVEVNYYDQFEAPTITVNS